MTIDELRFWLQVIRDSERTIFCNPEHESRIKTMVDAYNVGGLFTVRATPFVPKDRVYVLDENAQRAESARPVRWDSWRPL